MVMRRYTRDTKTIGWDPPILLFYILRNMSKDFQNKYVGYMLLALVLGVIGMGVIGIVYFAINGSY